MLCVAFTDVTNFEALGSVGSESVDPMDLTIHGPVIIKRAVVAHSSTSRGEQTLCHVSYSTRRQRLWLNVSRLCWRRRLLQVRSHQFLDFVPDVTSNFCPGRHAISVVPGRAITAR